MEMGSKHSAAEEGQHENEPWRGIPRRTKDMTQNTSGMALAGGLHHFSFPSSGQARHRRYSLILPLNRPG